MIPQKITNFVGLLVCFIFAQTQMANATPASGSNFNSGSRKWESDQWETEIGLSVFNLYIEKMSGTGIII